MSALRQPDFREIESYRELQVSEKQQLVGNSSGITRNKNRRKTTKLSRKKRSSAALKLLTILQQGTSGFAAVMMLGSIAVYVSTVRIPQLWSQEYETLEALQRQERDLVAVDEALKYEIARQAEQSELAMSTISPENTLFLQRVPVKPQLARTNDKGKKLWSSMRQGY